MLSEVSQTRSDLNCLIPLVCGPWSNPIHRDRGEGGCQQPGAGGSGAAVRRGQSPFPEDFCGWVAVMVVQPCECI